MIFSWYARIVNPNLPIANFRADDADLVGDEVASPPG